MPRTAKCSATRTMLGGAALLLALGNAGCTSLLGIEELETQGDAAPPTPDATPTRSDAGGPDGRPMGNEYLGNYDELDSATPVPTNTIWAVAIQVEQLAKLDKVGFLFEGSSSVNIKLGLYVDIAGKPGENHIPERSDSVSADGRSELDVSDDPCLFPGTYWLVMRVDQDTAIRSTAGDASPFWIEVVNDYPYSADLPNPFVDGLEWNQDSQKQLNVYLVTSPAQTADCIL